MLIFLLILQAAVEEGIVVGGGCTLLRLASKVDAIKDSLDNDEEKVRHLFDLARYFCFRCYGIFLTGLFSVQWYQMFIA